METQLAFAHDSTLTALEVNWQEGIVMITLKLYSGVRQLFIDKVCSLRLSRDFEWGESYQVNSFLIKPNEVEIEMQSGDVITVGGTFRQNTPFLTEQPQE